MHLSNADIKELSEKFLSMNEWHKTERSYSNRKQEWTCRGREDVADQCVDPSAHNNAVVCVAVRIGHVEVEEMKSHSPKLLICHKLPLSNSRGNRFAVALR
jgi:hypothetical protein